VASRRFSVCSTASYSFIPQRLFELICYCLPSTSRVPTRFYSSKPYSDNPFYHHQTFKDLKFVWQRPLLQERLLASSKVRQQTISGLPKPRSLRQRRCNPHRPGHLPSPGNSPEYSCLAGAWMTRAPYATTRSFWWGQIPNRRPGVGPHHRRHVWV
jgi:hypothetical protein